MSFFASEEEKTSDTIHIFPLHKGLDWLSGLWSCICLLICNTLLFTILCSVFSQRPCKQQQGEGLVKGGSWNSHGITEKKTQKEKTHKACLFLLALLIKWNTSPQSQFSDCFLKCFNKWINIDNTYISSFLSTGQGSGWMGLDVSQWTGVVLQALHRSPTGTSGRKDQATKHKSRLALKVLLKLVIKPSCKVAYFYGKIRVAIIALDATSM